MYVRKLYNFLLVELNDIQIINERTLRTEIVCHDSGDLLPILFDRRDLPIPAQTNLVLVGGI